MAIWPNEYVSVSFEEEDLAGDTLSGTFVDVSFVDADLTGAVLNGLFINCDFTDATMENARLYHGTFTKCIGLPWQT
jgi:uncharacterized protein YjbI with pentapeptide repeats